MPYVTQTQIQTAIPPQHLTDALDDDRDGVADADQLDAVIAQSSQAVDGLLSGLFTVPFDDPAPAPVAQAAFIFACELIYARRGVEKNPFTAQANQWRDRLEKIGAGKMPLDAAVEKVVSPGASVIEDAAIDVSMT